MNIFSQFALTVFSLAVPLSTIAMDNYPVKGVTILVPYSVGGPIDVLTRALSDGLRQKWNQPVIIDNKPGANEIIAASLLTKAPADGYTIMASTEAATLLNPLLYKKLPYNPATQFVPISLLAKSPLVFTVPASSKAGTMKQFVELAKSRTADPIRYGSTGIGGPTHLPFASLEHDNNLKMIHAPYKGGAPVMQDLLAGHIEAGVIGSSMIEPFVKSGKLKALAVSADKRLESLPDVPTFAETGVKDINATYILGLVAPVGTPSKIIEKISDDARAIIFSSEFQKKNLAPFGFVPVGSSPSSFTEYLKQELPAQKKRVENSGVQLEF